MSEPRFGCRNPNGNKMRRNTETQLRKSLRRNLRNKMQGRRIPRNRTKKDIRKERSEDPICLVSRASLHSSDCLSRHETTQGAIEGRHRRAPKARGEYHPHGKSCPTHHPFLCTCIDGIRISRQLKLSFSIGVIEDLPIRLPIRLLHVRAHACNSPA